MLDTIILRGNNIGPAGAAAIAKAFTYNSTVTKVDMSENDLGEEGGMAWASTLQINATLCDLSFSGCSLLSNSLIALATVLQSNNNVLRMDISNNIIPNSHQSQSLLTNVAQHISNVLRYNYGVKALFLSKMGFSDWVMCDFFSKAVNENQSLVTLDLSSNRLSRDGAISLFDAIKYHPTLANLKLSCCAAQDQGAIKLAEVLKKNVKLKRYDRINLEFILTTTKSMDWACERWQNAFCLRTKR